MFEYAVWLHHIFVSPGHNYFGQNPATDLPLTHPTNDLTSVELHAGKGLVGDRFYAVREDFDGQVTFVAQEVIDLLRAGLENTDQSLKDLLPVALRRNVVIEDAVLNGLIGHDFEIGYADEAQRVRFHGAKHCSPCRWMDIGGAVGALKLLKGRGGLRAQILTDGLLRTGPAKLYTTVELNSAAITDPLPKPRLP